MEGAWLGRVLPLCSPFSSWAFQLQQSSYHPVWNLSDWLKHVHIQRLLEGEPRLRAEWSSLVLRLRAGRGWAPVPVHCTQNS